MRRIVVLLSLFAIVVSAPAVADGTKEGAPGTNVEMPFLIAPIAVDGKLVGYVYISSKLVATSQSASIQIRDKLAFIQDAFVRDVNAAPVGKASDPTSVDKPVLAMRLVADARRIVGSDKVASIVFTEIQSSSLHPSPTTEAGIPPSQRDPAPTPSAAPAPAAPATTAPAAPAKP